MKIIVVFNMRGGIGKTTLAVTVAESLAQYGAAKVLLADADPQRNASHRLCPRNTVNEAGLPSTGRNISKYLSDSVVRNSLPDPVPYIHRRAGTIHGAGQVDILMGALDLLDADRHFAGRAMIDGDRVIFSKLGRAFQHLSAGTAYDAVVIDSPPGLSTIVQGALGVADLMLVPMVAQSTSELLYGTTQKQIERHLVATGTPVPPALVVAMMYDASHSTFLERIRILFKSPLRLKRQKSIAEHELFSSDDGITIKEKYGTAERELKQITQAVMNRLGLEPPVAQTPKRKQGGANVAKGRGSRAGASSRAHRNTRRETGAGQAPS
jgi:chromosome partitioning protein